MLCQCFAQNIPRNTSGRNCQRHGIQVLHEQDVVRLQHQVERLLGHVSSSLHATSPKPASNSKDRGTTNAPHWHDLPCGSFLDCGFASLSQAKRMECFTSLTSSASGPSERAKRRNFSANAPAILSGLGEKTQHGFSDLFYTRVWCISEHGN